METLGIIAFAFGQQSTKASGPSNDAIGSVALAIKSNEESSGNRVVLATQWEVALYCAKRNKTPDVTVSTYGDEETHYIDTKAVLDASLEYFKTQGVTKVILVAQPTHLWFITLLLELEYWKTDGFIIVDGYHRLIRRIPFDKSPGNRQWWTRRRISFIAYLAVAGVTGLHGNKTKVSLKS